MTGHLELVQEPRSEYAGWYPVALATDAPDGQVIGRGFLGSRVAVFRSEGQPVVLDAYCAHLGADLSIGRLTDGDLECPYHHFRYGSDGACTWVPGSNTQIPKGARVHAYPAEERYGVIWASAEPEPLYPIPHWPGHQDSDLLVHASRESYATEPWVILANTFDFLHLQELHGLTKILSPSDITRVSDYVMELEIGWDMPEYGEMSNTALTFGTNTNFTSTGVGSTEMLVGFSGTPVEPGHSDVYTFVACVDNSAGDPSALEELETQLAMTEGFVDRLVADDRPVFDSIRFKAGATLPEDRVLNYFLRFLKDFPRVDLDTHRLVSLG